MTIRRMGRLLGWGVVMLLLGGCGSVLLQQVVLPMLAASPRTQHWPIVRSLQEHTTIIERTTEVRVTQETITRDTALQVRGSIGLVVSQRGTTRMEATGVFVTNDGVLAVDAAAVPPGRTTTIYSVTGTPLRVTRVVRDAVTGIAFLVTAENEEAHALSFSRAEDLFVGQHLIGLGIDFDAQGHVAAYDTQLVAFLRGREGLRTSQWHGTLALFGAADAEVFVTRRGELAGLGTRQGIVPVSAVRFALERFLQQRSAVAVDLGITYHSADPTRDGVATGVIVDAVAPAARRTFRVGDRITAVGDTTITAYAPLPVLIDQNVARASAADGPAIPVTVVRGDRTLMLMARPLPPRTP